MAELIVDDKNRITIPRELRRRLGIESGSKLEVQQRGGKIVIRPAVPIEKPTEAIWRLAASTVNRNPKRQARESIAKRKRLGK